MRIITGTARNVPLASLEGEDTRPTSERVKEALFSMIQFEIEGRRVLDLFAGSGQLGLEALSRGAAHATFIDNSRKACDIIIDNARRAKLFDRCRVSATDHVSALRGNAGREKYDLVFLDPPYASGLVSNAIELLVKGELLAPRAIIVCETPCPHVGKKSKKREDTSEADVLKDVFGGNEELFAFFTVRKTNTYGISRITLIELVSEDTDEE